MQVTAHACAATERLLLLLGWERAVSTSHAKVARPSEPYRNLKASLQKRRSVSSTLADSSWEREHPKLRMPAISTPVTVVTHAESNWTPDAFEVGEQTGTV
jgi:hypothetical protein